MLSTDMRRAKFVRCCNFVRCCLRAGKSCIKSGHQLDCQGRHKVTPLSHCSSCGRPSRCCSARTARCAPAGAAWSPHRTGSRGSPEWRSPPRWTSDSRGGGRPATRMHAHEPRLATGAAQRARARSSTAYARPLANWHRTIIPPGVWQVWSWRLHTITITWARMLSCACTPGHTANMAAGHEVAGWTRSVRTRRGAHSHHAHRVWRAGH